MKAHLGVDMTDSGGGDGGSGGSSSGGGGGGGGDGGNNNHNHRNKNSSSSNHLNVPEDCVFARLLNKLNKEGNPYPLLH